MSQAITPEVLWAQRSHETDAEKNYVLLTLLIPDCKEPQLKLEPTSLEFRAKSSGHVGEEKGHDYHLHIDFFKEIDPEKSLNRVANGQGYYLKLVKKDLASEYWPRLTKEKLKYHYIKTDFDKWVDEDEQEEVPQQADDFGGMPFGGGMEGLEALQGMGGMGGMGMGGMGMGGMGMGGMGGDAQAQLQKLMQQSGSGLGMDEDDDEEEEDLDAGEEEKTEQKPAETAPEAK